MSSFHYMKAARKIFRVNYRAVIFFAIVVGLILLLLTVSSQNNDQLRFFKSKHAISKLTMKVVSNRGVNELSITDPKQLDSVNLAFHNLQERHTNRGGGFKIWADITVYKEHDSETVRVLYSEYNGWWLDAGGKTMASHYLFDMVRRYSL